MALYFVAVLTPFDTRGRVDLPRLRAHVLWLAAKGADGFVPTGTTGEFLYLTDREREAVHRTVIEAAMGRPVYPCTWDPSPHTTAYLSDAAREQGASGVLMPPPLYYELDDPCIAEWYRAIGKSVRLPVLAYHNPAYCRSRISSKLYHALKREGLIAGMKDSSADVYRLQRLATADPDAIYAGGDKILGKAHAIDGLAGFVSALGNVWPSFCLRVFSGQEPDLEAALVERVNGIKRAGGLRAMKALLGMGCRMPMLEPADEALIGLPPRER